MATEWCTQLDFGFQAEPPVRFDGGSLTSDAACCCCAEFDHRFRLTEDLADAYEDPRRADRHRAPILALLRPAHLPIVRPATRMPTLRPVGAPTRCCRRWWGSAT